MFLWHTLNFDVHRVIAVLNAVHHLTAVDARIFGPQLCYLQGGVSGHKRVVDHRHSVQILRFHFNFPPRRHQDGGDSLLGYIGPFDAVGEWGDGRGSGVIDSVFLEITGHHHLAAQQRTERHLHGDADTQCAIQFYSDGTSSYCQVNLSSCLCLLEMRIQSHDDDTFTTCFTN